MEAYGTITNCGMIQILEKPIEGSVPVCSVERGAQVLIDMAASKSAWYKVYTQTGFEGWILKFYVNVLGGDQWRVYSRLLNGNSELLRDISSSTPT